MSGMRQERARLELNCWDAQVHTALHPTCFSCVACSDMDPLDDVAPSSVSVGSSSSSRTSTSTRRSWVEMAYAACSEDLQATVRSLCGEKWTYGSDCSGCDAPIHSLKEIQKVVPDVAACSFRVLFVCLVCVCVCVGAFGLRCS